jgi:hypothetical protein
MSKKSAKVTPDTTPATNDQQVLVSDALPLVTDEQLPVVDPTAGPPVITVMPDGTQIAPPGAMDRLAAKGEPQRREPKPAGQYLGKWGRNKGRARTAEEIAADPASRGKPRSQVEDLVATQPGDKLGLPAIPAPAGASGKASAAAPAAEKPAPKTRKAKATKGAEEAQAAEGNGAAPANRAKKTGLRSRQVKVLAVLAKSKTPMSRRDIHEKDPSLPIHMLSADLGAEDPAIRAANDKKDWVSLVTLEYVTVQKLEGEPLTYTITPAGRAALAACKGK